MSGEIIQGLDIVDIQHFVSRKNRKFQAITLHEIEEIMGKDTEEYLKVRKIILDAFNEYTRSVLRIIFGDDLENLR